LGLGRAEIELLISLKESGHDIGSGSVMEIGAQQLSNGFLESRDALAKLAEHLGISAECPLPPVLASRVMLRGGQEHLDAAAPRAKEFWQWLGYQYASIDIDGSPGSILLDLNYDQAPKSEKGRYQLVTNCGTTEHVANQLNAFQLIHELCAPDGIMIHNLPAQGYFTHGLVNYNPKFLWMLARSNFYKILHQDFTHGGFYPLPEDVMGELDHYQSDARKRLKDYQAADCGLVFVVKKTRDIPFVAPLDVATGTQAPNKMLEERYWSVYTPTAIPKEKNATDYLLRLISIRR
jgi:hypothetical protein